MLPEKEDQDTWKTACKSWLGQDVTALHSSWGLLYFNTFCAKLVLLAGLNLYLCAALKPTLKLSVLHSGGKQSPTRTDSVDDFSLNQGSPCIWGTKEVIT